MPLKHSKSPKAFEHNLKAEMNAGKPKDQSLAIAYSVQRKAKKPKKMAEGGPVSAKSEKRPMPAELDNDAKMVHQNSGKKPAHQDNWLDQPTVAQARAKDSRAVLPIKHPKMVPSNAFSVRMRDEEDHLQESASVNEGPQRQPPEHYNEEGANRQGPKVAALEMKKMAHGGPVMEPEDHDLELMERQDEAHLQSSKAPSEDEGESEARSLNEIGPNRQGPRSADLSLKMMADGGMADGELEEEHHDSIAAAIMAKRDRLHAMIDSGSMDEDRAAANHMAEGGEILPKGRQSEIHSHGSMDSDDSSQVDLSRNADEDANEEDQSSFNALRKENYSESAGLAKMDSPKDSNEHGDEIDSDDHDMISSIRRKMSAKRQFGR